MSRCIRWAALLLALAAGDAFAFKVVLEGPARRVIAATAVYAGKVVEIAEQGKATDELQPCIATVRVSETLLGKGMREIKIAFNRRPNPGIHDGTQVAKGDEGAFLVHPHPAVKDTYVFAEIKEAFAWNRLAFFKSSKAKPSHDFNQIKAITALICSPMKGLKSKDADERKYAACVLVQRYAPGTRGKAKTEPVPAAESKLILETLADPEWKNSGPFSAEGAFLSLGLTAADGWTRPKGLGEFRQAAREWLKANAGKYKMRRILRDQGGPSEEPGAGKR
jgi:hypothetical protein